MNAPKKRRLARRLFKSAAVLLMLGVFGIAALLGSLWVEHATGVTLPTPTGSFAVGRVVYDWADDGTADPLAPVAGTRRELLVWIWYPSAPGQSAAMDDYLPPPLRAARAATDPLILKLLRRTRRAVGSWPTFGPSTIVCRWRGGSASSSVDRTTFSSATTGC